MLTAFTDIDFGNLISRLGIGDWIAILGLISSALVGIFNILKKALKSLQNKPLHKLISKNEVDIFIPSRDIGRPRNVVAQEDYATYDVIRTLLVDRGFKPQLRFIAPDGNFILDDNRASIVICGPKSSYIVEDFFDRLFGIDFIHDENGIWHFVDETTGNKIYSPLDISTSSEGDLAFFGKVQLPQQQNTEVTLICGIHALGSLGAATFLSKRSEVMRSLRETKGKKFYMIIRSRHTKNDASLEIERYLGPRTI